MSSLSVNNAIVETPASINFQSFPLVTVNVTANSQTFGIDVRDASAAVLSVRGTFSNVNVQFEFSNDSTDGTNGTWQTLVATRTNSVNFVDISTGAISANPGHGWQFNLGGINWVRLRSSTFTSGTCIIDFQRTIAPVTPVSSGANAIMIAHGQAAHNASTSFNPLLFAGYSATGHPAATNIGTSTRLTCTPQGALVVKQDSAGADLVRTGLALATTTAQSLFAAGGNNVCNYLTDIQAINTGASAVDLIILDGATEIWRITLPINVPVIINGFRAPLRSTANTAFNVNLSAAGTVRVNAQGHRAT